MLTTLQLPPLTPTTLPQTLLLMMEVRWCD